MAENPFGPGMSDFGLLPQVSGDVLGSPQKVTALMEQLSQLQSVLSQAPPPQNTPVEAALRGALGAASAPDVFVDPLTGQESLGAPGQGVAQSFLAGAVSGIEGSQADALARYEHEQQQALRATEQREAVSAAIRNILAVNPSALEKLGATDAGQRAIGMLAYGIDVPIDPTAKSREADESILRKQRIDYYREALKAATSPSKKAEVANRLRDLIDPDGALGFSPTDFLADKVPTFSEMVRTYGDPGGDAWTQYQTTKDYPGLLAKMAQMRVLPKSATGAGSKRTSTDIKSDLALRMGQVRREWQATHGKDLTWDEVKAQLTEEEQALVDQFMRSPEKDDVSFLRYLQVQADAYRSLPDVVREDPEEAEAAARAKTVYRINSAKALKKQSDAAARKTVKLPPAPKADGAAWQKMIVDRAVKDGTSSAAANKALVDEFIRQGKQEQIPAAARKNSGM